MGLRLEADFPCQVAQRFFIASEARLRAATLMQRLLADVTAGCFVSGEERSGVKALT